MSRWLPVTLLLLAALVTPVSAQKPTTEAPARPAPPAPATMGDVDVATAAATLAKGGSTAERMAAAKRLGTSRNPRALQSLVAALKDENRDVRWAAIEALGELGDRRAVPPLVEYLEKPEAYRWARRLIASALGVIGDRAGVPPLVKLLEDPDPFVRRLAALALVTIGEPSGIARVRSLLRDTTDPTLATVRREYARAEEQRWQAVKRSPAPAPALPASRALRPHEWAGIKVGAARLADVRSVLGKPVQDAPDFALYTGERLLSALRVDSVVLNADSKGVIESIFVFPVWGTVERDVRALLGTGAVGTYGDYLKASGRTAYGAGTRAGGKLHYLPPETVTETYPAMGMLVVYDAAEAGPDRLVKLIIVH
jgi:hypothetical protein